MDTGVIYLDNQIDSKINRQMDTGVIYLYNQINRKIIDRYLDNQIDRKVNRQMERYIQIIRQTVQDKQIYGHWRDIFREIIEKQMSKLEIYRR